MAQQQTNPGIAPGDTEPRTNDARENDPSRTPDDGLEQVTGNDAANEHGERPDVPAGPTGDMDQPGMDPTPDSPD